MGVKTNWEPTSKAEAQHFAQHSRVSKTPAEAAFIVHLRKRWQADFTPDAEQELGRILGTFAPEGLAGWVTGDPIDGVEA
jgi:hypothetical protein